MESKWYNELPPKWDEIISSFENSTIFHSSEWLNHIADQSSGYSIRAVAVFKGDKMLALVPYVHLRKAILIKIFASPLGGTGTNFMGPLFDSKNVSSYELLSFLLRQIRLKGYHHVEMNSQVISNEIFESAGFQRYSSVTNIIELPSTEMQAWSNLKSSCRNRVNKAQKSGCTALFNKDQALPTQFQNRLEAVYRKQNLKVPFGVERPRSLCENVVNFLSVRVLIKDNIVAVGLFPFDNDTIYFWGGAAFPSDYKFYPNEIMHWEVIKFAVSNNINHYNMCGGSSQFKNKFGGKDVEFATYSISFLPFLDKARALYKWLHFMKVKIKGALSN